MTPGANRGTGLAIAKHYAAEGAKALGELPHARLC